MPAPKVKLQSAGVQPDKLVVGIPTGDDVDAETRVRLFFKGTAFTEHHGWGASTFRDNMTIVSASATPNGTTTLSFTVQPMHCNRLGNLHGGCTATVFDICTTTALAPIAKPGLWTFMGVSRTLNVTYLRPVASGETVLIESEVMQAGKRLCTIKGVMKRKSDGAIVATCEHGKVNTDPEMSKI